MNYFYQHVTRSCILSWMKGVHSFCYVSRHNIVLSRCITKAMYLEKRQNGLNFQQWPFILNPRFSDTQIVLSTYTTDLLRFFQPLPSFFIDPNHCEDIVHADLPIGTVLLLPLRNSATTSSALQKSSTLRYKFKISFLIVFVNPKLQIPYIRFLDC